MDARQRFALVKACAAFAFASLVFSWGTIFMVGIQNSLWLDSIRHNFAAMIMMPICAGFSLVTVLVFRVTAGEVKFNILGASVQGAAGPAVLWVLLFLAQMFGIWLLWQPLPSAGTTDQKRRPPAISLGAERAPARDPVTDTRAAPSPR